MYVYPSISIDLFHTSELGTSSTLSRAHTKDYLTKKGQGFADQNHATSKTMKSAQIGFNEFITRDFDVVDTEKLKEHENWSDLHLTMPFFCEHVLLLSTLTKMMRFLCVVIVMNVKMLEFCVDDFSNMQVMEKLI